MARNAKVDRLREVNLFSGCSVKELTLIARASDEVSVDRDAVVVKEGTRGHEFYLILSGHAVVTRRGRKIAELTDGQYFGEMALLDGAPRDATVTALAPTTLLVLGQREFAGILDTAPGVARKLLRQVATRVRSGDTKAVTH